MRRLLLVAALVLAADLVTKILVNIQLPVHGAAVRVVGDWIRLFHVKNNGSAFSLFQGGRYFFIAFSLVSIALIVFLARTPRYRKPPFALSLGSILGGALGNLTDRIAYGAVTDWIDVGYGAKRWPTFNVADMGVTVGVIILAVLLLLPRREGAPDPAEGDEGA